MMETLGDLYNFINKKNNNLVRVVFSNAGAKINEYEIFQIPHTKIIVSIIFNNMLFCVENDLFLKYILITYYTQIDPSQIR